MKRQIISLRLLFVSTILLSTITISHASPHQKLPDNFIGEHKIYAVLMHVPNGETKPLTGAKQKEAKFSISNNEIKTQTLETLEILSFGQVKAIKSNNDGTYLLDLERDNRALIGFSKVKANNGMIEVLMVGIIGDGRPQLTFFLEPPK